MDDNKKETHKIFKDLLLEFMIETWGERCPDYEESCPSCQAWDNYDIMIGKLESGDNVYEYMARHLTSYDLEELEEFSRKGWNVCAASYIPTTYGSLDTMFYLRRKL